MDYMLTKNLANEIIKELLKFSKRVKRDNCPPIIFFFVYYLVIESVNNNGTKIILGKNSNRYLFDFNQFLVEIKNIKSIVFEAKPEVHKKSIYEKTKFTIEITENIPGDQYIISFASQGANLEDLLDVSKNFYNYLPIIEFSEFLL